MKKDDAHGGAHTKKTEHSQTSTMFPTVDPQLGVSEP